MINNIRLVCKDGILISIAVGKSAYCLPRESNADYTHVEIGLWSEPIPELTGYADGEIILDRLTVYGYVPIEILSKLLNTHNLIK